MTTNKSEKYTMFRAGAVIKKYGNQISIIYLIWSYLDIWNQIFNVSSIGFRYYKSQTNSQKAIIATYKEFLLRLVLNLKSVCTVYMNSQKFFGLTISLHLALQHVKESFPDMYRTPILPNHFPRTKVIV